VPIFARTYQLATTGGAASASTPGRPVPLTGGDRRRGGGSRSRSSEDVPGSYAHTGNYRGTFDFLVHFSIDREKPDRRVSNRPDSGTLGARDAPRLLTPDHQSAVAYLLPLFLLPPFSLFLFRFFPLVVVRVSSILSRPGLRRVPPSLLFPLYFITASKAKGVPAAQAGSLPSEFITARQVGFVRHSDIDPPFPHQALSVLLSFFFPPPFLYLSPYGFPLFDGLCVGRDQDYFFTRFEINGIHRARRRSSL